MILKPDFIFDGVVRGGPMPKPAEAPGELYKVVSDDALLALQQRNVTRAAAAKQALGAAYCCAPIHSPTHRKDHSA